MLAVIRGLAYRGYVTTIFGIWLLGFYLLITSGAANEAFTPDALAWYVLVLVGAGPRCSRCHRSCIAISRSSSPSWQSWFC